MIVELVGAFYEASIARARWKSILLVGGPAKRRNLYDSVTACRAHLGKLACLRRPGPASRAAEQSGRR
eukprot:4275748-Prymnesium_polylepis.2